MRNGKYDGVIVVFLMVVALTGICFVTASKSAVKHAEFTKTAPRTTISTDGHSIAMSNAVLTCEGKNIISSLSNLVGTFTYADGPYRHASVVIFDQSWNKMAVITDSQCVIRKL